MISMNSMLQFISQLIVIDFIMMISLRKAQAMQYVNSFHIYWYDLHKKVDDAFLTLNVLEIIDNLTSDLTLFVRWNVRPRSLERERRRSNRATSIFPTLPWTSESTMSS